MRHHSGQRIGGHVSSQLVAHSAQQRGSMARAEVPGPIATTAVRRAAGVGRLWKRSDWRHKERFRPTGNCVMLSRTNLSESSPAAPLWAF